MDDFESLIDQFDIAAQGCALFEQNNDALDLLQQRRETLLRCINAVIARAETAEAELAALQEIIQRAFDQLDDSMEDVSGISKEYMPMQYKGVALAMDILAEADTLPEPPEVGNA